MKVSIITVCYNSSKTILDTINSVKNQTYKEIEYIIIDGNSTDETLSIVKKNRNVISKYISEPDRGLYDAMNKGINWATGEIIGILNSDDIFFNNDTINNVVHSFNSGNHSMLYGNIEYYDSYNKTTRIWIAGDFIKNSFLTGWHPPHPAVFIKKEIYLRYGLYDINFSIAADFDLTLRLFEKHNVPNCYLPITLVKMKIGGKSSTFLGVLKGNKEISLAFKKNKLRKSKVYFAYRYLHKLKQFFKNKNH